MLMLNMVAMMMMVMSDDIVAITPMGGDHDCHGGPPSRNAQNLMCLNWEQWPT